MKAVEDPNLWMEAYLDTPITPPRGAKSPEEAMKVPGCYLISRELDPDNKEKGWSRYWARLCKYNEAEDHVVVRSSEVAEMMGLPRTVWFGTVQEYRAFFKCD